MQNFSILPCLEIPEKFVVVVGGGTGGVKIVFRPSLEFSFSQAEQNVKIQSVRKCGDILPSVKTGKDGTEDKDVSSPGDGLNVHSFMKSYLKGLQKNKLRLSGAKLGSSWDWTLL